MLDGDVQILKTETRKVRVQILPSLGCGGWLAALRCLVGAVAGGDAGLDFGAAEWGEGGGWGAAFGEGGQEAGGGGGYFGYGCFEGVAGAVGEGLDTADLADVLAGGGFDLLVGRGRGQAAQHCYVSAHAGQGTYARPAARRVWQPAIWRLCILALGEAGCTPLCAA